MSNILNYTKLTFILICEEEAFLPQYLGSTLRGAMGNELRRICCTKDKDTGCNSCAHSNSCHYTYLFTNLRGNDAGWMKGVDTKPNPFIIEPPLEGKRLYKPGEELRFNILLVGNSIDCLPFLLFSVENMCRRGLGVQRKGFRLDEVFDGNNGETIYRSGRIAPGKPAGMMWKDDRPVERTDRVRITFKTPYRFISDGKLWDSLNFEIFIRGLFRRCSMLSAIYCECTWQLDFKAMLDAARHIAVKKADFRWHDWERYSSRSNSKIKMGGIVGEVIFKGELTAYMPYIEAGSIVHAGKGCTMGLGQYTWDAG